MSAWNDEWLQPALAVRRGHMEVHPGFRDLQDAVEREFGARPLDVGFEAVTITPDPRMRLKLVFERSEDYHRYYVRDEQHNLDQRVIANTLRLFREFGPPEIVESMKPRRSWLLGRATRPHVFIAAMDFESAYVMEVLGAVTDEALHSWETTLLPQGVFWCTARSGTGGTPVVFTYTEEQARWCRDSGQPTTWSASYFEAARENDEFGLLLPKHCDVRVDSKENFDNNYESSWFYYWR
jgi:hypothetical protein